MLEAGYRIEVAALTGPLLLRGLGTVSNGGGATLDRHRRFWPESKGIAIEQLIADVQRAKITGRGGAEFPFWRKLQAAVDAGLDVDDFAPRLSFFWNGHNNFFEEAAKFQIGRAHV